MKFSERWLREWVNPAINHEALVDQITMAGLEVESTENVAGDFYGVVVGEVVDCVQHSNANKLQVTKINIGGEQLLSIVCGAANCRQGLKVAVATVGAVLPDGLTIKAAKLRGEPSEGMLCSYSELGININQAGIAELYSDAPVGTDLRDYLQLNDCTIELSITPNRGDCLSIHGVARDVAAINQLPLEEPEITPVAVTINDSITVNIEIPEACPRYLSRVVKGINTAVLTPFWMQEKLRRGGIRTIDPVVDITHYVLLELGQPMHAYDLNSIDTHITVRMANEGETLTLLDNHQATLTHDTLVIADKNNVLSIGGILGGKTSGVSRATCNVLLECAFFNPLFITGCARRYGLHTEASRRFERGVDPALQHKALERATQLLLDICGGEAGPIANITHEAALPKSVPIQLHRNKLDRLLGHIIADDKVGEILQRLGCKVSPYLGEWRVIPPSWRFDIKIEEDLIEEVARIYGYNNIPDAAVLANLQMTEHHERNLSLKRVKMLLVDKGYQEAMTYSFVDPKTQALLHPDQDSLLLPNPISTEMSVMRLSLWTGLLSALKYNQNRQQNRIRLFESGLRFVPDNQADLGIRQELMLAGVISGHRYEPHWDRASEQADFYDIKGDIESVLELTGKQESVSFRACAIPALHPGQSAAIYLQNEKIGYIGVLHPELAYKLDLAGRVLMFELHWEKIAEALLPEVAEISRFPANRRDISVVIAENIPAAEIIAECKKVGENQLVGVNLFDVYRGKGIDKGLKSLAISLILQDNRRTLEEEEIAAAVAKCVAVLKERFKASLRD